MGQARHPRLEPRRWLPSVCASSCGGEGSVAPSEVSRCDSATSSTGKNDTTCVAMSKTETQAEEEHERIPETILAHVVLPKAPTGFFRRLVTRINSGEGENERSQHLRSRLPSDFGPGLYQSSRRGSMVPPTARRPDALDVLLDAPKEDCPRRLQVFQELIEEVECGALSIIFKLSVDVENPVVKLGVLQYIRAAVALKLRELRKITIVKMDDERIFLAAFSSCQAIQAGITVLNLIASFTRQHPELKAVVSCGMDVGRILLLANDYFGDPVNIASKLGEDNARPWEFSVSRKVMEMASCSTEGSLLLESLEKDWKNVLISGVEISYCTLSIEVGVLVESLLPKATPPEPAEVLEEVKRSVGSSLEELPRLLCVDALGLGLGAKPVTSREDTASQISVRVVMMQSDMSGFTRLTRKYGIMHFLTLIVKCRQIYQNALKEFGGRIVKYDGDNVITFFETAAQGARAAMSVLEQVNEHNRGLEKDYQIRLKLGMSAGDVLVVGEDIVGHAWDVCCALGEDLAEIGEILVTKEVRSELLADTTVDGATLGFEDRLGRMDSRHEKINYYNMQAIKK